jgi:tetratricopeptide (TPR) repeat protein
MPDHRRQPPRRGRPEQGRHRSAGPRRDDRRRDEPREESKYEPVHLPDEIVKELHTTARPGKGEILVKVFADAAAAFQAEDFDEAIQLGDQAKHMALRAVSIREFLGLAYYHQGRWQESARELSTFRRISGTTEQNPVLADSYRAMGKPEKAVEYADEIVRGTVPDAVYFEGAIVGAGALADMDRLDDAIHRLEGLDLQPKVAEAHHLRAWYMLGDLLARKGRFTQAREWFEAVAAADPDMTDASERLEKLR